MDAVARQAGVSKQTVYSHFKCKEELFSACITSKVALYQLDSAELDGRDLNEALSQYGHRVLELHNDPQVTQVYRLLVSHCLDFPHLISEFKAAGPTRVEAAVSRLLLQGDPQRFDETNAHTSALSFLKALEAPFLLDLMWNVRQEISEAEITQHVSVCVDQLLNKR